MDVVIQVRKKGCYTLVRRKLHWILHAGSSRVQCAGQKETDALHRFGRLACPRPKPQAREALVSQQEMLSCQMDLLFSLPLDEGVKKARAENHGVALAVWIGGVLDFRKESTEEREACPSNV